MEEKLEMLENRYKRMIEKKTESKYIVIYTSILNELWEYALIYSIGNAYFPPLKHLCEATRTRRRRK